MKKIGFPLVILFFCMGIALFPQTSSAALTALNDTEMRDTTGQAGISFEASDTTDFDWEIGNVAFGDADGTGDGIGGFLSFNDVIMRGSITVFEPVTIDITTQANPFDGGFNTGLDVTIKDMAIDIDHFEIGSITVGSEVGSGKSFGSITIRDYRARISGNLRIWAN